MKFKDYFQNDFETRDDHYLPNLRTHYYRCRNEQAMDAIRRLALSEKAVIKQFDEEHHEVTFETAKYSVTATVISPHISETAVDFKILTYYTFPFGKGIKIIERLYQELDKLLPFKGKSLY